MRTPQRRLFFLGLVALVAMALACTRKPDAAPADAALAGTLDAFWNSVAALCGSAYGGKVAESEPPDTVMSRATLVMHVRECSADTIRIPFHVGENRSRTWVLTRTPGDIRLKHDHRHADGTADSVTMYGGDTHDAGTIVRQEFRAYSVTASLIPAARTNVWTMELHPGHMFVYALRREGSTRKFRAEFDLMAPDAQPPAPWGSPR